MNIFLFVIILFSVLGILGTCGYRIFNKKDEWIEYMPSVMWQLFLVCPFLYQVWDMEPIGNNEQGIGILIFSIVIFVGDFCKVQKKFTLRYKKCNYLMNILNKIVRSGYFYLVFFILLAGYHIASMGENIPLLYSILHPEATDQSISLMREEAVKLLDVPFWVKYVFRWNTNIIPPIGIIVFWKNKKYFQSVFLFALGCIYSFIITSEAPFVFFIGAIGIYAVYNVYKSIPARVYIILGILLCAFFIRPCVYFAFNDNSPFRCDYLEFEEEPLANRMPYMDVSNDELSTEQKLYNKVLRRIVMVPAVVGNYWYKYAIVNDTYFGYGDMLPWARMGDTEKVLKKSPSNIVGVWAYVSKWPDKAGETISSNTSMDADAYGRGGMLAVIITALIYMGIRLLLKWLNDENNELVGICYVISVVIITLCLTSAPIQAILVAQGLLPLIIAMFIVRMPDEK